VSDLPHSSGPAQRRPFGHADSRQAPRPRPYALSQRPEGERRPHGVPPSVVAAPLDRHSHRRPSAGERSGAASSGVGVSARSGARIMGSLEPRYGYVNNFGAVTKAAAARSSCPRESVERFSEGQRRTNVERASRPDGDGIDRHKPGGQQWYPSLNCENASCASCALITPSGGPLWPAPTLVRSYSMPSLMPLLLRSWSYTVVPAVAPILK
jgi:hypothetical protein